MLEQQVVGGEQAQNKALKEKHKRRKKHADERRLQLVAALQESNEDSSEQALLNVYDSIQEEVRAKSKMLEKVQEKVREQLLPPPHPRFYVTGFRAVGFRELLRLCQYFTHHIVCVSFYEIPGAALRWGMKLLKPKPHQF